MEFFCRKTCNKCGNVHLKAPSLPLIVRTPLQIAIPFRTIFSSRIGLNLFHATMTMTCACFGRNGISAAETSSGCCNIALSHVAIAPPNAGLVHRLLACRLGTLNSRSCTWGTDYYRLATIRESISPTISLTCLRKRLDYTETRIDLASAESEEVSDGGQIDSSHSSRLSCRGVDLRAATALTQTPRSRKRCWMDGFTELLRTRMQGLSPSEVCDRSSFAMLHSSGSSGGARNTSIRRIRECCDSTNATAR